MAPLAFEDSNPDELPPPLENQVLNGPPPTAWRDFIRPKLRRFPGHGANIQWLDYLGHGIHGLVFKVKFGDDDPVALKIVSRSTTRTASSLHKTATLTNPEFWQTRRPKRQPRPNGQGYTAPEWGLENECLTVALLEKMKWLMADAKSHADRPISPLRKPITNRHAAFNLYAFSDEAKCSTPSSPSPEDTIPLPPFPPLPICYGWTAVDRDDIPHLDPPVPNDVYNEVNWHWALVYELVPGARQHLEVGQAHLDFFYAVGFAMEPYKPDNWHGGRLIDINDVCSPLTPGWSPTAVVPRNAKSWFCWLGFTNSWDITRKIVPCSTNGDTLLGRNDDSGRPGVINLGNTRGIAMEIDLKRRPGSSP